MHGVCIPNKSAFRRTTEFITPSPATRDNSIQQPHRYTLVFFDHAHSQVRSSNTRLNQDTHTLRHYYWAYHRNTFIITSCVTPLGGGFLARKGARNPPPGREPWIPIISHSRTKPKYTHTYTSSYSTVYVVYHTPGDNKGRFAFFITRGWYAVGGVIYNVSRVINDMLNLGSVQTITRYDIQMEGDK